MGHEFYGSYLVLSNEAAIHLQLIDSAYINRKCASLSYPFYKKANSIILIYDVTNRESFNECNIIN